VPPFILLSICWLGRFRTNAAPDVAVQYFHPKAPLMTGITVTKQQKLENLQENMGVARVYARCHPQFDRECARMRAKAPEYTDLCRNAREHAADRFAAPQRRL
jgi:hypothetical protein